MEVAGLNPTADAQICKCKYELKEKAQAIGTSNRGACPSATWLVGSWRLKSLIALSYHRKLILILKDAANFF